MIAVVGASLKRAQAEGRIFPVVAAQHAAPAEPLAYVAPAFRSGPLSYLEPISSASPNNPESPTARRASPKPLPPPYETQHHCQVF